MVGHSAAHRTQGGANARTTSGQSIFGASECGSAKAASIDAYEVREKDEALRPQYRVTLVVVTLGWVDLDFDDPSSCPAAQPVLPNSHMHEQNRADSRT